MSADAPLRKAAYAIAAIAGSFAFSLYAQEKSPASDAAEGCAPASPSDAKTAASDPGCSWTLPPTIPIADYYYDGVYYYYYTACCENGVPPELQHYGFMSSDEELAVSGCPDYAKESDFQKRLEAANERAPRPTYKFAFEPEHPTGPAGADENNFQVLSFRGLKDPFGDPSQNPPAKTAKPCRHDRQTLTFRFAGGNPHSNFEVLRQKTFVILEIPAGAHVRSDEAILDGKVLVAVEAGDGSASDPYTAQGRFPYNPNAGVLRIIEDSASTDPQDQKNHRSVTMDATAEPGPLFTARVRANEATFPDRPGFDLDLFIVTRAPGFGK